MPILNYFLSQDTFLKPALRSHRPALVFLLVGWIACSGIGCQSPGRPNSSGGLAGTTQRPQQPAHWVQTELYFGAVSADVWANFLAEFVTPRFPDGLTVFEASGQWRGKDGVIHSIPTRVLLILHSGDPDSNRKLEEIRSEYKARFQHESVLRVDAPTTVSF